MIGINLENPGNLQFLRVIGIRWQNLHISASGGRVAPPLADMGCFVLSSVFPGCQKRIWKRAWKPLKSVQSGAPLKVCV